MTDELVKRLRADNDESFVETLCGEAADLIEALTAETAKMLSEAEYEYNCKTNDLIDRHAEQVKALTAERDQWIQHAKNAVWSDSEEVKLLTADNARLREVVLEADKLLCGDLAGLQWKRECRSFLVWARAVLKGESHE